MIQLSAACEQTEGRMEDAYDQAGQLPGFRPDRNANCETDPQKRMGRLQPLTP